MVEYATWNPSDKASAINISNSNLTATGTSATTWSMVRSNIGKSSGKRYWEITMWSTPTYQMIWTQDTNGNLDNWFPWGVNSGSWYYGSVWWLYFNGTSNESYWATYTTWDVIGIALDMDNWSINFYKNWTAQWATSTLTWTQYAAFWTLNSNCTANFWASAFSYSVPSGYNSGLYTELKGITNRTRYRDGVGNSVVTWVHL